MNIRPQIKNGILNIDKPQGITSHDVVDVIRKIFVGKKIGHTGTLDPLATGVLPICIGDATKLSEKLTCEDKAYEVKMLLGVETDSFDVTGKIVFASVVNKDEIYIKERIKRFIGKQEQIPPLYSAIHLDGKRAYEYARAGVLVELKPREIEIFSIDDIEVNLNNREVAFTVVCSKGTYIRSLVSDIGQKIGCGAIMTELRRIKTGNFEIEQSIKLYDFLKLDYDKMIDKIISIEEYFKYLKKINLDHEMYKKFLNGVVFEVDSTSEKLVRVYLDNRFRGLGIIENNMLKRYIIE
ncbi:MAG: tRNA pseudouridine(55) synthase TruB [Clostridia bacterium]